jgi:hypothetical protein
MADAWADLANLKKIDTGEVTSGDLFGTREFLKNNYLHRMAGAVLRIYGNTKQEAMYPVYMVDADEQKLDRIAVALCGLRQTSCRLLVANPLDRYLLNSPMMQQLKKDDDGGLTLYVQSESPGKDKEANWLPAPKGPFMIVLRLYWPKVEVTEDKWKQPLLNKII